MSDLPYETRIGNLASTPMHKLPVALIDGKLIADSSLIIEHLQQRSLELHFKKARFDQPISSASMHLI
jgi:glutathione S-transferase